MVSKNIFETSAVQFIALGLGLLGGVFLTRMLGPEGRGIYAVFKADIELAVLLFSFGFGSAATYFVSNKKLSINKLFSLSLFVVFLGTILFAALICLLNSVSLTSVFFPESFDTFPFFTYVILMSSLGILTLAFNGILAGAKGFREINSLKIIASVVTTVVFVSLWFYGGDWTVREKVTTLFYCLFFIGVFSALYLLIGLIRRSPERLSLSKGNYSSLKMMIAFSSLAYFSDLINFLNYRLDIWFVEYYESSFQLGLYSLSISVAQMLWLIPASVSLVLLPFLNESEDKEERLKTFLFFCRVTFVAVVLLSVGILVLAPAMIPFIYGSDFAQSVSPLQYLVPGIIFSSLTKVLAVYIVVCERISYNVVAVTIGAIVTVVFDVLLIPSFGIEGAAIATSISYLTILIVVFAFIRFGLGLKELNYFVPDSRDWNRIMEGVRSWQIKR